MLYVEYRERRLRLRIRKTVQNGEKIYRERNHFCLFLYYFTDVRHKIKLLHSLWFSLLYHGSCICHHDWKRTPGHRKKNQKNEKHVKIVLSLIMDACLLSFIQGWIKILQNFFFSCIILLRKYFLGYFIYLFIVCFGST